MVFRDPVHAAAPPLARLKAREHQSSLYALVFGLPPGRASQVQSLLSCLDREQLELDVHICSIGATHTKCLHVAPCCGCPRHPWRRVPLVLCAARGERAPPSQASAHCSDSCSPLPQAAPAARSSATSSTATAFPPTLFPTRTTCGTSTGRWPMRPAAAARRARRLATASTSLETPCPQSPRTTGKNHVATLGHASSLYYFRVEMT